MQHEVVYVVDEASARQDDLAYVIDEGNEAEWSDDVAYVIE
ncbi:hypothetical protein [Paraburkholderia phenoliruptrix]|uniref:Uncharacterized protein n=1 Tax=Paraburkholderia phenoliruptrix TaxID=252970 RepID=A0A6J5K987_9BURK|nr:hypothetical protein [Paraburkholderia phenoliruptrix]MDR6422417.1 hypothetical protein [Paraburkholderia phenoliruptrix]CAB4050207.1 hypothetical protein LMG9964_03872 [Paraburkholderia phenoliruptrix]